MTETATVTIALPAALLEQADSLARQLDLPRARVVELALAAFLQRQAGAEPPDPAAPLARPRQERAINQGDVFWVQPRDSTAAELGYHPHPYVVIQDDILNRSRIATVVVCALTSNLRQAKLPGNVLLDPGEAGLPKQSVVDVSKVSALDKILLGEQIGALSPRRIQQILAGMRFLQVSFFGRG